MFVASPPDGPASQHDLRLVRGVRGDFPGPAQLPDDPGHRAQIAAYMTDLARIGGREVDADVFGYSHSGTASHSVTASHGGMASYGEMAEALIASAVHADEPVDLLILAFSVHDVRPGRQTAAYLSHVTPGAPVAFAICDQGAAAAFSGLRIAREYATSAAVRRALLIVVEQGALPYGCPVSLPARHQGVALLMGEGATPCATVVGVRQHPGIPAGEVAAVATTDLAVMAAGRSDVTLVLGDRLAAVWTGSAARTCVAPSGQPCTGVWWGLVDEMAGEAGLVVAADYDPELRYLCLAAFEIRPGQ